MQLTGNLVADTICRTAEIGLTITGAADAGNLTIIDAAPVAVSDACPECSRPGPKRAHIFRLLVDLHAIGTQLRAGLFQHLRQRQMGNRIRPNQELEREHPPCQALASSTGAGEFLSARSATASGYAPVPAAGSRS